MDFGYETQGILLFTLLSIAPVLPAAVLLVRLAGSKEPERRRRLRGKFLLSVLAATTIYVAVCADAFLFEPNHPVLERKRLTGTVSRTLTVLHLSDLHLETDFPKREQWLLDQLEGIEADLVLITGDLHQTENSDPESLARVLGEIAAPLGVYACVGFDNVALVEAAAPQIEFLVNEAVVLDHSEGRIGLCGLTDVGKHGEIYATLQESDYSIVMNHTPDLADEASEHGVDLYLCGHTHGGQVRIPLWGALITNTDTGKKYEGGWYRSGDTAIHTSRGLGLEPSPAPQVRFFCRPEITLITVEPA